MYLIPTQTSLASSTTYTNSGKNDAKVRIKNVRGTRTADKRNQCPGILEKTTGEAEKKETKLHRGGVSVAALVGRQREVECEKVTVYPDEC